MNSERGLIMWGATGQARVLCELIAGSSYTPVAFVDRKAAKTPVAGAILLRTSQELTDWVKAYEGKRRLSGALAVGWVSEARLDLGRTMEMLGIEMVTLVHRTAWIARDAEVGSGCHILAGARVCAGVHIGPNSIINTGSTVDHDTIVGEGCHVTPGVVVAGEVTLGRNVFLGAGCTILPRIRVGDGAIVGAGALVLKDVPAGATVVGVPAKPITRK